MFHQVPPDGSEPLVEGNPAAWNGPRDLDEKKHLEVVLSLPSGETVSAHLMIVNVNPG